MISSVADENGTGAAWDEHLSAHYDELFAASEQRASEDDVFKPVVSQEQNGLVYFEIDLHFDDARPHLHGLNASHMTLDPYFCPVCVFDDSLPMRCRMAQYVSSFRHPVL